MMNEEFWDSVEKMVGEKFVNNNNAEALLDSIMEIVRRQSENVQELIMVVGMTVINHPENFDKLSKFLMMVLLVNDELR